MNRMILNGLMVLVVIFMGIAGAVVYGEIHSVRQSRALQSSFERKIQRLEESGKNYAIAYDEDNAISGVFTFRNANDMKEWVNANFERIK